MSAASLHRLLPKITGITMHVLTPKVGFIEYRYVRMRSAEENERTEKVSSNVHS